MNSIKTILTTILLLGGLLLFNSFGLPTYQASSIGKKGHEIKLTVKGLSDTVCYLAYHYGGRILVKDTFPVNAKGQAMFSGSEPLPGGIYLAVLPGTKFFEFLIDKNNQHFNLSTDTLDLLANLKVSGSEDNQIFADYKRFLDTQQKESKRLKKLKDITELEDSLMIIDEQIQTIDASIFDYRKEVQAQQPKSFLAAIINSMQEPELSEQQKDTLNDKQQFLYFKEQFLDNVAFNDPRMLRTPIVHNKIKYYLEKLTAQVPDSINAAADYIISKVDSSNSDMFRFVVSDITNMYEQSKIMGMDAVFVHMAQNYYLTGQAFWMDSSSMVKVRDRVNKMKNNLIGLIAPRLNLIDTAGNFIDMHSIDSEYTLLLFWDYKCGHCKKQMPAYLKLYEKYQEKGLEIYAICTKIEVDKLKEYIDENNIPWLNVYDPYNMSNFRMNYDIYSTPTSYLLDKDKKIIAKRLGAEQLEQIMEQLYAEAKTENRIDK